MAMGDDGTLYVGGFRSGKVHAVRNPKHKSTAPRVIVIDTDLDLPSGVAFHNGDLFVGAVNRILRYPDISAHLANVPEPEVITDQLPDKRRHGWKFIHFGPDNLLYIPVGAPCNICLSENPQFASILRMDIHAVNKQLEIYASGIRNSVGFDWHPQTHELWFTDNGRDLMGDAIPPCELNRAPAKGLHFGYPFFHGDSIPDPEFAMDRNASDYIEPVQNLGPHVAPLGMSFYTGSMFPEKYRNQIIIAEHGSWNRSEKAGHTGYRLTLVSLENNSPVGYEPFVEGWLQGNKGWGRPVATLVHPDGSLLVSDDRAGVIYRISYASN